MQPGDSYEAPVYSGQAGLSWPPSTRCRTTTPTTGSPSFPIAGRAAPRRTPNGRFNCVRCPLGTNYNYATAALFFPFSTINADGSPNNTEITPYDADPATGTIPSADFRDTPRPDGNTCFAMALMLCYNQFAVTLPTDAHPEVLHLVLPHHLPDRHGRRHGTQGGPEGHHLRDRRPGELHGNRQPGERRQLQLLQDSL